jgi:hypothetical protein
MSEAEAVSVWMACGYAVFLLAVAYALDVAARRVATRTSAWRTGGFSYHEDHDAWRCPQDQWLWPSSFDPDNRVMRYRASPLVCNACPVKATCTTSAHGREVSRPIDPWPSSEAERFHRGIACAVAVLAALWPLATALMLRTAPASLVLVGAAVAVALGSWPLWTHLRRTPAGFPEHVPVQSLDDALEARAKSASRRTAYRSDRRPGSPDAGWSRLGKR